MNQDNHAVSIGHNCLDARAVKIQNSPQVIATLHTI